ncbi:OsmC family protein [Mycolicibacterium elephantis]|uniref:OsmC family protein n=1 Tax=Mycolicibacterium elephantis TaxID=81858 RepID=UPI0009EEE092|nr:OsmC family protein [Mycolicibacterium elephantis]
MATPDSTVKGDEQMTARTRNSIVSERQEPVRRLYADSPLEALTLKAARTSAARIPPSDPFHGEVEIGTGYGVSLRFGLDRHVGGLHDAPNPGDLLCAALAACADGSIRMVADLLGVRLTALEVEVSGELDVRGCLNIDRSVRVGFESLTCTVHLAADETTDQKRLDALVAAAERACVNLDTLRGGLKVTITTEKSVQSAVAVVKTHHGADTELVSPVEAAARAEFIP